MKIIGLITLSLVIKRQPTESEKARDTVSLSHPTLSPTFSVTKAIFLYHFASNQVMKITLDLVQKTFPLHNSILQHWS